MAVNQMLPSLSATRPCGPDLGVLSGYSLNSPVFGSRRPSLLAAMPVYQREPSGARAGSCGRECGVGTSYSLIWTVRVCTAANAVNTTVRTRTQSLRMAMAGLLREIVVVCAVKLHGSGL